MKVYLTIYHHNRFCDTSEVEVHSTKDAALENTKRFLKDQIADHPSRWLEIVEEFINNNQIERALEHWTNRTSRAEEFFKIEESKID